MKCYAINLKTLEVKAYVNKKVAQGMGNGSALFTNMEELCGNTNMSTERILSAFNHNSENAVKRFSDRKTGIKRLFNLVEDTPITETYWDSGEYNSKLGSKKTPSVDEILTKELESVDLVKTKKVSKPRGAFAGKMIKALVTENPRKVNTKEVCGYASFNLLLKHGADMPYEFYIKSGGRLEDLKWDISKGWAEVYDV
tara:strand:+ start:276 stop:869 length:594 start_codon:yes stop_codon:yes gene_type:complete